MIKYQAKITPEDIGYFVEFPDLDGCVAFGETRAEALEMAQDALNYFLLKNIDKNQLLPVAKSRKVKLYRWVYPAFNISIALFIRDKRMQAGLSQSQLAKLIGFNVQQLQNLELPTRSNPTVRTLEKIAQALNSHLEIKI